MRRIIILSLIMVLFGQINAFAYSGEIDSFIHDFGFEKAENDKTFDEVEPERVISINAFDVDDKGNTALIYSVNSDEGQIRLYNAESELVKCYSYQNNNAANFIILEGSKIGFTGTKFIGFYVIDIATGEVTAYKWTGYDDKKFAKFEELRMSRQEKRVGDTLYYMSNNKNEMTAPGTSLETYRYLIAEKDGDSKVLYEIGISKYATYIFLTIFIALLVGVKRRRGSSC